MDLYLTVHQVQVFHMQILLMLDAYPSFKKLTTPHQFAKMEHGQEFQNVFQVYIYLYIPNYILKLALFNEHVICQ